MKLLFNMLAGIALGVLICLLMIKLTAPMVPIGLFPVFWAVVAFWSLKSAAKAFGRGA